MFSSVTFMPIVKALSWQLWEKSQHCSLCPTDLHRTVTGYPQEHIPNYIFVYWKKFIILAKTLKCNIISVPNKEVENTCVRDHKGFLWALSTFTDFRLIHCLDDTKNLIHRERCWYKDIWKSSITLDKKPFWEPPLFITK